MKFTKFFKHEDSQIAAQIKAATKITMDEAARERARAFLFEYAKMHPIRANTHIERATTVSNPFSTFFTRHSMPAFAAVLVLAVGGGTAAAAEGALPGDTLYPVKVHVNEEMRATLTVSPKAKADWAVNRAERRLEEAATLGLSGKLSDAARAEINTNIDEHVKSAVKNRQRLESENDFSDASEVETNIGAIALARENILDGVRAAKVLARAEAEIGAISTMSTRIEPQEIPKNENRGEAYESETVTKGHRAAAKARIEATKKFLKARNSLTDQAREQAQERLKAATEAFFTGDDDDARGDKEEASSNFEAALEAATDIQTLVSDSDDSNNDSDGHDSEDKSGGGQDDKN